MNIDFLHKNEFLSNLSNLPDRDTAKQILNRSAEYWRNVLARQGDKTDKEYVCEIFADYNVCADMFSGGLKLYLYSTPLAEIPIVEIENSEDFSLLIKKLVFKERAVPQSMGAAIIKNYKKEFINHSIIILSKKYYSNVQPETIGLSADVWKEKSFELRREHEVSHFMTQYFYGISKQSIHDEIIADFMGITAAFGKYVPQYFLAFLGLEDYPEYRNGGRLENYLPQGCLQHRDFPRICQMVKAASENIAALYEKTGDRQKVFHILCETTVADMAAGRFANAAKIEFELLYEKYFSKVYNYIYFCVPNFAVADDLTSDTFYKAYLYLDKYNGDLGSRYTWLCAIARNVVKTYFSKSRKGVVEDAFDEDAVSSHNTETYVEKRELLRELRQLIFKLPEKHRELIAMKYTLGKTNREISKDTGLSESNVGTTVNRVIEKLRKQLKNYM